MKCTQYGLLFWIFSALVVAADNSLKLKNAIRKLNEKNVLLHKIAESVTLKHTQAVRFKYRDFLGAFYGVFYYWDPEYSGTELYELLVGNTLVEYDPDQYVLQEPMLYKMSENRDIYLSEQTVKLSNIYLFFDDINPSYFRALYRYELQLQIFLCHHPFIVIKMKIHGILKLKLNTKDQNQDDKLLATLVELYCLKMEKPGTRVLRQDEMKALEDVKSDWEELPKGSEKDFLLKLIDALENGIQKIPEHAYGPPPEYSKHDWSGGLEHSERIIESLTLTYAKIDHPVDVADHKTHNPNANQQRGNIERNENHYSGEYPNEKMSSSINTVQTTRPLIHHANHAPFNPNADHQSENIGQNEHFWRGLFKRLFKKFRTDNGQTKTTGQYFDTTPSESPPKYSNEAHSPVFIAPRPTTPSESPPKYSSEAHQTLFITPRPRRRFFLFKRQPRHVIMVLHYPPPAHETHPSPSEIHTDGELD